jgi:hypothetical protein
MTANANTPPTHFGPANDETSRESRLTRVLWQGKVGPAFWTITGVFSILVNIILIVALLILGQQLFNIKRLVNEELIGGLYHNFVAMDEATIITTVQVEDTIPVVFDLPVQTDTTVVLTEATPIEGASVVINAGVISLNAPANIVLPAGVELPIALDITVPVDTEVPVVLTVPVDIPLSDTELHDPFVGLQNVIGPYYRMLNDLPDHWEELPGCEGVLEQSCQYFFEPEPAETNQP